MRELTPPSAPSRRRRLGWLALVLATAAPAAAQEPRLAPPGQVLPPLPTVPPRELDVPPRVRVFVRQVRVVGSTILTPAELAAVVAPYEDRHLSTEDLEALRVALTLLYVGRGYVNSGAILPDQAVEDGVVTYRIVEGGLTDVEVRGTRWLRPRYVRDRLALGTGPPLNVDDLQRRIQYLLEDPRIRRIAAELRPGLAAGESILAVDVEEHRPFRLTLGVDNYQTPSVGAERGLATLEHLSLTGHGDVLSLRYGRSDGVDPLLDFRYALPVTARDTVVSAQYRRNTVLVLEEPFADLDIESESEVFTVGVRQPVYRTPAMLAAVELIGEHLRHQTTLLGVPFSLLPGARDGESVVSALRLAAEWLYRTQEQVVAVRSRWSVGLPVLGATEHRDPETPDGRFFAWLGQFQWARRLPVLDSQAILRTDLQLTPDPLLTLEQVAVGGRFTVRGYRENTLVRDNAFLGSLEVRIPVVRNVPWAEYLEVAPFYDYGRAWSALGTTPDPLELSSVGVGLRWAVTIPAGPIAFRPQLEVYWGYRLHDVPLGGDPDRFQDLHVSGRGADRKARGGLHFQLQLAVF